MNAFWGIAVVVISLASIVVGDLVSEEVRARLETLPNMLLRLAARRVPAHVRDELLREWQGELHVFLRGAEAMPVTRLVRGVRYAAGLLRVARSVARAAGHGTTRGRLATAAVVVGRPLAGVMALIGVWWFVTAAFDIRSIFLPSPADMAGAFVQNVQYLLEQALVTLNRTAIGFALAAACALFLGLASTMVRAMERTALKLLSVTNAHASVAVAFAPLLIVWQGFGARPKVTLVALICFIPIAATFVKAISTAHAKVDHPRGTLRSIVWSLTRMVHASPQFFVGLKVAMPFAIIGIAVSEIQSPSSGLGGAIARSASNADTALALSAIVLLFAVSVTLYSIIVLLERILLPSRLRTGSG